MMVGGDVYMPLQHIDNTCMPVLLWLHSGMGTGMYTMIQLPLFHTASDRKPSRTRL